MGTNDWGDTAKNVSGLNQVTESGGAQPGRRSTVQDAEVPHAVRLRRTIETEIVPRLLAARGRLAAAECAAPKLPPQRPTIARHVESVDCLELQRLLLAHESTVAGAFVEALIHQGIARDEIYMDLLAPVARGLGKLWDDDAADFTQITVALGRLQILLHELGRDSCACVDAGNDMHSVLLMPMPGEQHTFGLLVIGDFFRRRGWNVCCEFPKSTREALEIAQNYHFDVVGISLAGDQKATDLSPMLPMLRRVSRNPALRILVGGPLFLRRPELAIEIGADGTAESGEQAVTEAERLVARLVETH